MYFEVLFSAVPGTYDDMLICLIVFYVPDSVPELLSHEKFGRVQLPLTKENHVVFANLVFYRKC